MKIKHLAVIVAASSMLAACGGGSKNSPDEFAVVDRPPLTIPPEAGLVPPRPGEPKAQPIDPGRRAFEALFPGKEYKPSPQKSAGELVLLSQMTRSDPDVRSHVENRDFEVVKKTLLLADLLEIGERVHRPDNIRVDRSVSASSQ